MPAGARDVPGARGCLLVSGRSSTSVLPNVWALVDYIWTTTLAACRGRTDSERNRYCVLPGEHLPRPPAQATIRTGTRRLALTRAASNERRSRDETHLRTSAA